MRSKTGETEEEKEEDEEKQEDEKEEEEEQEEEKEKAGVEKQQGGRVVGQIRPAEQMQRMYLMATCELCLPNLRYPSTCLPMGAPLRMSNASSGLPYNI